MQTVILIAVAVAVLAPLAMTAWLIDDWSRDLTTNRASTDTAAEHPLMRPITQRFSLEELDAAIASVCDDLPAWSLAAAPQPPPTDASLPIGGEPVATRHMVRTTSLMRYKDDVWLVVGPGPKTEGDPEGEKLRLHLHSRSRVGKGDLGQNPRNLRELNGALLSRLVIKAPPPTKAD